MAMPINNTNTRLMNSESLPVNTNPGFGAAQPTGTDVQTHQPTQRVEHLHPRLQIAGSGQPLTEQNLAEHNQQQTQLLPLAGYNTNLHCTHIATLAEAGREFGITPHDLREERTMQHSEAANPMEWYLAERDRNRPEHSQAMTPAMGIALELVVVAR